MPSPQGQIESYLTPNRLYKNIYFDVYNRSQEKPNFPRPNRFLDKLKFATLTDSCTNTFPNPDRFEDKLTQQIPR